jgi:glycosyltransferase involved in cell wall biosynthesis
MGARICIDCSPLLVRSAGVKTYLYHWLRALRNGQSDMITGFLDPPADELDHTAGLSCHFLALAALWVMNRSSSALVSRVAPECSVFHASNLLRRFPKRPRLSATIHDLTAWIVPQFHSPIQRKADQAFADGLLRSAHGMICVSENSKRDAERLLKLNPEKMRVIYPGVPTAYFVAARAEADAAFHALKLRKPYFLSVGTIEPRKNVDGLLSAWLSLPLDFRSCTELIVVGTRGWESKTTWRRLLQTTGEKKGVRYIGYVPEQLMPGLTAGARGLIYPSFYEGFGFPVVQAMAAGCPAIVSGVSSLPEVTGGAALLVDPGSEGEIAAAILRLSESDALHDRIRAEGRQRAGLFTWERAARESLEYFQDLAG